MKHILVLICILQCTGLSQVPTNGLIAWYPLNGTAKDESGQGNNGNCYGVTPINDHVDKPTLACHFTGTGSYIAIEPATLDTQFTALTISAWVNPYNFPAYILSKKHYSCPSSDIALSLDFDTLHVTIGKKNFSFYYDTNFCQFGWNHIAATWDGDTVKAYANGYVFGSAEYTGALSWNRQKIYVGKDSYTGKYFGGAMDEVRIYDRALSESEIQTLRDYTDTVRFIYLLSPVGGEKFLAKQKRNLAWVSNMVNSVTIEYSTDSGTNWQTIASDVAADAGTYQWTVPQLLSTNCKVRVHDTQDTVTRGMSDSLFSIIDTVAYIDVTALLEAFYDEYTGLMVPDVAYVSLRPVAYPDSIADYSAVYLDSLGHGTASFLNAPNGTYYVVINHRNHLETWTAAGYAVARGSTLTLDFSANRYLAYGNNMVQHNGRWCIFAGDINQDGVINQQDMAVTAVASENYVTGYVSEDVNGDGYIDPLDLSFIDGNAFNHISIKRPPAILGKIAVRRKWEYKTSFQLLSPFAKVKGGEK